jgi:hypothetical protein
MEEDEAIIDDEKGPQEEIDLHPEDGADPNIVKEDDESISENAEEEPSEKPKEPTMSEVMAELAGIKEKNAELEKAARRAFYQERHEKKAEKADKDEVTLTDAELTAIIEANKDDPKVMLNAVTYKMQQMMKVGTKAAVNEVEVKNKNMQLHSYVREIVPDFDKEGSEAHESISRVMTDFGLDDHPHGTFLGWAAAVALQLPKVKQASFEAGKAAALAEKADGARKADIKGGQVGPTGKRTPNITGGDGGQLSTQEMETFDRIFGHIKDPKSREAKLKLYRDQIKRGSNRKAA